MDKELQKKIKELENRIAKLERPGTNLGTVREDTFGIKIRDRLIVPVKRVGGNGAACPTVGEICVNTLDGYLYVCRTTKTWDQVT
jgi:hypothetical protein